VIITQTPLRVSFAGGGTDLPSYYEQRDGYVVSAAIDKSCFVIVSERYDEKICLSYARKEIVDHVSQIQHELVREAMRVTEVTHGVEITLLGEIPSEGSGLGSSSSFTVGLLNALHTLRNQPVAKAQLAEEACEIELTRCKKPIGKQDQYIAAFGGVSAFLFRRDGAVEAERVPLSPGQLRRLAMTFSLLYTNQTRSANHILAVQSERAAQNLDALDGIKALAYEVRDALYAGDFERIGTLLDKNWHLKKQLAPNITNPHIDAMYGAAKAAGALGAKVCGAGGGGFLMVCCPPAHKAALLDAMAVYRELPISFDTDGSKVIFNYRRASWR